LRLCVISAEHVQKLRQHTAARFGLSNGNGTGQGWMCESFRMYGGDYGERFQPWTQWNQV
jgi:hypothetical protein